GAFDDGVEALRAVEEGVAPEFRGVLDAGALAVPAPVELEDVEAFVVEFLGKPAPVSFGHVAIRTRRVQEHDHRRVLYTLRFRCGMEQTAQFHAISGKECFRQGAVFLCFGPWNVLGTQTDNNRKYERGSHPASHGESSCGGSDTSL